MIKLIAFLLWCYGRDHQLKYIGGVLLAIVNADEEVDDRPQLPLEFLGVSLDLLQEDVTRLLAVVIASSGYLHRKVRVQALAHGALVGSVTDRRREYAHNLEQRGQEIAF